MSAPDYEREVSHCLELILDGVPNMALRHIWNAGWDSADEPSGLGRALRRSWYSDHGAESVAAMGVLRGMIAVERQRAERDGIMVRDRRGPCYAEAPPDPAHQEYVANMEALEALEED